VQVGPDNSATVKVDDYRPVVVNEAEGVQVPNASFNTGEVKVCQFMGDSPITQANEHGFV
jgi:hypothetical protein